MARSARWATGLALAGVTLWGQVGTGVINGRVTDPSGAVIPAVKVTVLNVETNFQYGSTTNQEGLYRVQSLSPGPYRVIFEAQGFRGLVRDGIQLRVDDVIPIDAALTVGSVAEAVSVTAEVPLLETQTSSTGQVVEGDFLHKLPLYQRYINSTLNLVPGMTTGGYAYGGDLGSYHLAGGRSTDIGILEDGTMGNDPVNGASTIKPVQNSVAEVKVLTTTLPAEYGHSGGGAISVVRKTGTNTLHGMAANLGRTRSMQHRLFFDREKNTTYPSWFMMPEANVGGPVLLPKLYNGRDRTFFFFGYQKLIEKKSAFPITATPTPAMKAGDLSFGGIGNPIYDPFTTRQAPDGTWTRDLFPNLRVPQNRFDPVARKILEIDPWNPPNRPGSFTTGGPVSNFEYEEKARVFFEDFNARIDHQFGPSFKIFGGWTYNHQSGHGRPTIVRLRDFDGAQGNLTPSTAQNYTIGNTWVLSPTKINDIRVGYYRRRRDKFVPSYNKDYGKILGIPGIAPALLPNLNTYGIGGSGPELRIGENLTFRNDFTFIHGTHSFKTGYEILRGRYNITIVNTPSGSFNFGGQTSFPFRPNTGNNWAGFLLGAVGSASFDTELTSWLPRFSVHSLYFQDDWKMTPALTLNLGLRYSNESPYHAKYDALSNFDPLAIDTLTGRQGAIAHPSGGLSRRDNNNLQPRIGVAWHPRKRWVFRAGFAVNTLDVTTPGERSQFDEYRAIANLALPPGDPRMAFRISDGPGAVAFTVRSNNTAPFVGTNFGGRSVEYWDPNLRNPYAMNWHSSVQYELTSKYLVEVMYQAGAGVGMLERYDVNTFHPDLGRGNPALQNQIFQASQNYRPYPHFGAINLRSNFGHYTHHSGTVKLEKRYSRGLTFLTFYTFAKTIDSQDGDSSGGGVSPVFDRSQSKARAGYDRNHRYIATVTWELPFGKGRRWLNRGGALHAVLGGWELAHVQTIESGNPLTFDFANSPYLYYPGYVGSRRPNLLSPPALRDNWRDFGGDRFNQLNINPLIPIDHFAYPEAFQAGNAGRNIVTGMPVIWEQTSIQKNFQFLERFNLQLRYDFQNTFKTYNFNTPTTTVDLRNPRTFAKVTSDPRTASLGGQPLMNITVQLTW